MAKLPVLSVEEITAALDIGIIELDVPALKGSVKLKAFTLDQRDAVLAQATNKDGKIDARKMHRLLVVEGVVEPKLSVEVVSQLPFAAVEAISTKLLEMNGMAKKEGASADTIADVTFRQEP